VFQSHLELMAKALHPDRPHQPSSFPLVYQGASDDFLCSTADISGYLESEGIDFEGEFGVVVDEVPMRTNPTDALGHVKLIVLLNDISLRAYAGREITSGFGFLNAKPSTAFAPVAVTPDELGANWRDGCVHMRINFALNNQWFGHPHGGAMSFGFDQLIGHAARTRRLSAGTIIGSGTVSNEDRSVGSACIAERRAIEIIEHGAPLTPFMSVGDGVTLDVVDDTGQSVFGPIAQRVTN
jgi:fumarylacetoacetate (FAA) hydrolase